MFNDKHFSYSMEDGLWMWNRAKELDIPLFAGSSLVVCYRRPFLEHPKVRRPKPRTGFAAPATYCSCHLLLLSLLSIILLLLLLLLHCVASSGPLVSVPLWVRARRSRTL